MSFAPLAGLKAEALWWDAIPDTLLSSTGPNLWIYIPVALVYAGGCLYGW